MQRFYHNELKVLDSLLQALSRVIEKYNRRDLDLVAALETWLDNAVEGYKAAGRPERENGVLTWKSELVTAQRGVHPLTLEKVTLHRHQLQTSIAFRIMQSAAAQLQADREVCRKRLDEAGELAGQLIAAGLQSGVVTEATLAATEGQQQLEQLWKALGGEANIALGQKRLLLQVSRYDVWLLLAAVIAAVAEPV